MVKKILIGLFAVVLTVFSCSSGKYCVGGKKKYKRMKKDTQMMVF